MAGDHMAAAQFSQCRALLRADRLRVRTTIEERTAFRQVIATGYLTTYADDFVTLTGVRLERAVKQCLRIGMCGRSMFWHHFDHAPEIHHQNAVAQIPHQRQIMGNEHVGQVELLSQPLKQCDDLRLNRNIKRGGWFIKRDENRL